MASVFFSLFQKPLKYYDGILAKLLGTKFVLISGITEPQCINLVIFWCHREPGGVVVVGGGGGGYRYSPVISAAMCVCVGGGGGRSSAQVQPLTNHPLS